MSTAATCLHIQCNINKFLWSTFKVSAFVYILFKDYTNSNCKLKVKKTRAGIFLKSSLAVILDKPIPKIRARIRVGNNLLIGHSLSSQGNNAMCV